MLQIRRYPTNGGTGGQAAPGNGAQVEFDLRGERGVKAARPSHPTARFHSPVKNGLCGGWVPYSTKQCRMVEGEGWAHTVPRARTPDIFLYD